MGIGQPGGAGLMGIDAVSEIITRDPQYRSSVNALSLAQSAPLPLRLAMSSRCACSAFARPAPAVLLAAATRTVRHHLRQPNLSPLFSCVRLPLASLVFARLERASLARQ